MRVPEAPPLRKQYIVIDNNCRCPEAVGLALRLARFSDQVREADIRLFTTKTLEAEIHDGNMQHVRWQKRHGARARRDPDNPTFAQAIKGYDHYIKMGAENDVDQILRGIMTEHLSALFHEEGADRFYRRFPGQYYSIVNPERDLPSLLMHRDFFQTAYNVCMKSKEFRETLRELDLDHDMADQSLIAWYRRHLQKEPDTDVIMVSSDGGMIAQMKTRYIQATGDRQLTHFEHFDLQGFAEHVMQEVEHAIGSKDDRLFAGLEPVIADIDAYYESIMQKKRPDYKHEGKLPAPTR